MRIIARSKVVEYYTEHPGETFRTSWVSPSRVSDYLTGRCEQPWFSTGCIVRSLSPNRAVVEAWSSGRLSRIVRSIEPDRAVVSGPLNGHCENAIQRLPDSFAEVVRAVCLYVCEEGCFHLSGNSLVETTEFTSRTNPENLLNLF